MVLLDRRAHLQMGSRSPLLLLAVRAALFGQVLPSARGDLHSHHVHNLRTAPSCVLRGPRVDRDPQYPARRKHDRLHPSCEKQRQCCSYIIPARVDTGHGESRLEREEQRACSPNTKVCKYIRLWQEAECWQLPLSYGPVGWTEASRDMVNQSAGTPGKLGLGGCEP